MPVEVHQARSIGARSVWAKRAMEALDHFFQACQHVLMRLGTHNPPRGKGSGSRLPAWQGSHILKDGLLSRAPKA